MAAEDGNGERSTSSRSGVGNATRRRAFLNAGLAVVGAAFIGGCNQTPSPTTPTGDEVSPTPETPSCDPRDASMGHGMLLLGHSDIEKVENELLEGWSLDIVQTTWGDARSPYWNETTPLWLGRSGEGTEFQRKKNDLKAAFDGTGRRWCPQYKISVGRRNYAPALAGNLDADWRAFAEDLVELGLENTMLRPNAEFSKPWGRYPHRYDDRGNEIGPVTPSAEAGRVYGEAFGRCMRVMNSVDGADFTFLYNPAGHSLGITRLAWPPDHAEWRSWLDKPVVTPSYYDSYHSGGPNHNQWTTMDYEEKAAAAERAWEMGQRPELDQYQRFADDVGADIGIVEWGTREPDDVGGRGDNPWFVDLFFEYMQRNDWVFEAWWNTDRGGDNPGGARLWPPSRSILHRSRDAWTRNVLGDVVDAVSECRGQPGR